MTSEEIEATVCKLIGDVLPQSSRAGPITTAMRLREQLGMDSVALFSIVFSLEQRLHIDLSASIQALVDAVYVVDLVEIVTAVVGSSRPELATHPRANG